VLAAILICSLCFLLSACGKPEGLANSNDDLNHELNSISIQFIKALNNRDEKTISKLTLSNELAGLVGKSLKLTEITQIELKKENDKYINTLIVNTSDKSTSFIYHIYYKKVQGNWKIIDFDSLGLSGDCKITDDNSTTTLVLEVPDITENPINKKQIISTLNKRAVALGAFSFDIKDIEQDRLQFQMSGFSNEFITMMFHTGRVEFITEKGQVVATNSDILKASSEESDGLMQVDIIFNDEGAKKIAQATSENIGRNMEIRLDGKLIQNPIVHEPITGGRIRISQFNDKILSRALVTYLNFGPLPCDIEIMEKRTASNNRRLIRLISILF